MAELEPRTAPVLPGDVLAGKYRVERVLGAGGMGVVVAARHMQLGELVALKFLLPKSLGKADTVTRFLREARAAVRIKSEHVARVSDVGTLESGAPYIVMEHLEGQDLADTLRSDGPLDPEVAVSYVLQACEAIAEAHALGIVHRDLKPSNLFVTHRIDGAPLVKVLDFGIAKAIAPDGVDSETLTATNTTMGSPRYMSPEQCRSARKVDARSDIWSLGIILHELVSGTAPFNGEAYSGLLAALVMDDPVRLREARADAPEALEAVILRCLDKDPEGRYADIGEFARALAPLAPAARASVELISRIAGVRPDDPVPPPRGTGSITGRKVAVPAGRSSGQTDVPTVRDATAPPEVIQVTQPATPRGSKRLIVPALGLAAVAGGALYVASLSRSESGRSDAPNAVVEASRPTAVERNSVDPPAAPAAPSAVSSTAAPPPSTSASAAPAIAPPVVVKVRPAAPVAVPIDRKGSDRH